MLCKRTWTAKSSSVKPLMMHTINAVAMKRRSTKPTKRRRNKNAKRQQINFAEVRDGHPANLMTGGFDETMFEFFDNHQNKRLMYKCDSKGKCENAADPSSQGLIRPLGSVWFRNGISVLTVFVTPWLLMKSVIT